MATPQEIIAATVRLTIFVVCGYIGYCIIAFTVKVLWYIIYGIIVFPVKVLRSCFISVWYLVYGIIAFTVKVLWYIIYGIIVFPVKVLRSCFISVWYLVYGIIVFPVKVIDSIEKVIWYIVHGIIAFPVKVLDSSFTSSEQGKTQSSSPRIHYSTKRNMSYRNPNINHDHLKFKHSTRANAEEEVGRMKKSGRYDECERLNVYYNDEYESWFVGRGWRR